jgi:branched-subunit amino acid aminotransferase/4-amino-4-deoxychorismate lyase
LRYLENIVAKRAAAAEGFDEVVFAGPDGALLEGAVTNLFAVVGGRVFTAPLGAILPEWRGAWCWSSAARGPRSGR